MVMTMIPNPMNADNYTTLWKQADEALEKDLPKTEQQWLGQIMEKARSEKAYGQLLKAELRMAKSLMAVSPDSLLPAVNRLREAEVNARKDEPVLSMVYAAVLGHLYKSYEELGDDHEAISADYFVRSLAQPELLAKYKALDYAPLVVEGKDSRIFYNDLLSVIGFEAGNMELLHSYYEKNGNRPASLITALEILKKNHKPWERDLKASAYVASLDSLAEQYGDLPECGEVAIVRYSMMEQCETTPEERMRYIDNALAKWGSWQRMNQLRNAQMSLTQPSFSAQLGNMVSLPNHQRTLEFNMVRNIGEVKMTVSRLKLDATTELNPSNANHYAKLKAAIERVVQTETHSYKNHPSYKEVEDSMFIKGLPVGIYMIEITTDNKNIQPQRCLYYVSDLYVLSQEMPEKKIRYAVVSGTTGQPVAGATLVLKFPQRYDTKKKSEVLTCGPNGEVVYTYTNNAPEDVRAYTTTDKFLPSTGIWNQFSFYENTRETQYVTLYTDRSIYRPGQTVHVAALAFLNQRGLATKAMPNKNIRLTLRNANHKAVEEKEVTTDEFGMASADFVLPQNGLNGTYVIQSNVGNGYAHLTVDEYKRPTFQIEFPEVKESYQHGDTVKVKAYAKSYAGVPVQGAKVTYRVDRSQAFWWWRFGGDSDANAQLLEGETVTDTDGAFTIPMPMMLPESALADRDHTARFYQIKAWAQVTDQAGESHEGEMTLPLGNKNTAISCDVPEKSLREDLKTITFSRHNMAGTVIEGRIKWQIDGGEWHDAEANKPVDISQLPLSSGRHEVQAVCENDTVKQTFVVFSLADKRPCIETHDWFYQTSSVFPRDGKPVTIQVGSSDTDTHILYTIISGKRVLESGVIDQSNAILTRQFTYREEYGSGLLLTYAWVKEGQMYQHQAQIMRPLPDKRLILTWKTFRDRLTPGQKEEWTLHIARPDGTPAKAQLLAAMYDKSLDNILSHGWDFSPNIHQNLPSAHWRKGYYGSRHFSGTAPQRYMRVLDLSFNRIDPSLLSMYWYGAVDELKTMSLGSANSSKRLLASRSAAPKAIGSFDMQAKEMAAETVAAEEMLADVAFSESDAGSAAAGNNGQEQQMRENLNETAFFYPALTTDADGNVAVKFTLPESLTTWRFMGLGHDKEMNYGMLNGEAVAKKDVMIQPNMPRFVRQGDKATLSARIFNTGEQAVSGTARLQLIDPETNKVIDQSTQPVTLDVNSTTTVAFVCAPKATWPALLIAKCSVEGKTFSDGEQHYLPVLPDVEMVVNTLPFTQNTAGLKEIDLTKLFPQSRSKDHTPKLTVEYTNHPAWLMIQALPSVAARNDKDVISQATAFYANSLGAFIMKQNPTIKGTIEQWQQEQGSETSLMSSLQKNQDLKSLVIDETPWVMDADREADQKRQLINYFDDNTLQYRLDKNLQNLRDLQNGDGSWSWWPGMPGNLYMTTAVVKMLTRLNAMTGSQQGTTQMLSSAMQYLGKEMVEEVKQMRKLEREHKVKDLRPSETAVDVLYIWSLANTQLSGKTADARTYLVDHLAKQTHEFTIYGKARYFDTRKAYYSWRDYKIPTEVAAIEALKAIEPNDQQTVEEMQRWLLQSKRTQAWDTPLNSVDAVYAFLNGRTEMLQTKEPSVISLNGKPMDMPKATAGLGYVKTSASGNNLKTLSVRKTSDGTSWGAVYAQFMQPVTEIQSAAAGITVKRELLAADTQKPIGKALSVGDKIKIRITITAERDYDFVQLIDKRAACMEPVQQLSGYHWGYYCSPKDYTTNYYFDRLSKGKHVVETEYYVDRQGTYATGTCTVQCAYAPEYTAREAAHTIVVE